MYSSMLLLSLALLSSSSGYVRNLHEHSSGYQVQNQINDGIGKFGVDLHKNVMKHSMGTGQNVLVSPIGVYFSLALAHLGTTRKTRDELRQVMGLPSDEKLIYRSHKVIGELYRHMQHCEHANVSVYNGVFVQTGVPIKNTYLDEIKRYYECYSANVDFTRSDATNTINRWFEMETRGKISRFYDQPVSQDVKLVIANALTFNGVWDRPFPPEQTKTDTFVGEDGREKQVRIMRKTDFLLYTNIPELNCDVVGIPFEHGEHYLYILLPQEGVHLMDVVGSLNYDIIQTIITQADRKTIDLKLPMFSIKDRERMKDMLQIMGVHKLFESPDLDNMLTHANLKVTEILHNTELIMDEYGIDAWAGTTQEYKIYDEFIPENDVKQFWVQKPFMFFIHHPFTESVLYYGCVQNINEAY